MKNPVKSALTTLFLATASIIGGQAIDITNACAESNVNAYTPLSPDSIKIDRVFHSAPTKTYADGEVVILEVSAKEGADGKSKAPFTFGTFYFNTQTGDKNLYQLDKTLNGGGDNIFLSGSPDIKMIKEPNGAANWEKKLASGTHKLMALSSEPQRLERVYRQPDGKLLVITSSQFNRSSDQSGHTLHIGQPGQFETYQTKDWMKLRDGGSIYATFVDKKGQPHKFSAPFSSSKPTFDEKPLEDLREEWGNKGPDKPLGIRGLSETLKIKSPN